MRKSGIPITPAVVEDVMQGKIGAALNVVYQVLHPAVHSQTESNNPLNSLCLSSLHPADKNAIREADTE